MKTERCGQGYLGESKGACCGAPCGLGAHRIRGPRGSHSQPPSHWNTTQSCFLRILERRQDSNCHLHHSDNTVCTHTRAANFTCRAPQWSSLSLCARCPCTDVASHADLDGSDYSVCTGGTQTAATAQAASARAGTQTAATARAGTQTTVLGNHGLRGLGRGMGGCP